MIIKPVCNLTFGNEYIFHEELFYTDMTNKLKCKLLDKIKAQQFTVLGMTAHFLKKINKKTNKQEISNALL